MSAVSCTSKDNSFPNFASRQLKICHRRRPRSSAQMMDTDHKLTLCGPLALPAGLPCGAMAAPVSPLKASYAVKWGQLPKFSTTSNSCLYARGSLLGKSTKIFSRICTPSSRFSLAVAMLTAPAKYAASLTLSSFA